MPKLPSITKKDVQDIVSGAADHIVTILGERIDKIENRFDGVETRLDGVETKLDGVETRLDGVETRLGKVETEIKFMHQDINDLKADTPTQKEFNQLKQKVDRYIAP